MPIYISSSRSSSPIMNVIISLIALAVTVGLFVVALPIIGTIALVLIGAVALFFGWQWLKRKFGWESPDERMFRETMEQMERNARAQYQGEEAAASGVYASEETVVTTRRIQRRRMDDVEDIEGTPVTPKDN